MPPTPIHKTKRQIELRRDLADWLDENFPKNTWWIINESIAAFKEAIAENMVQKYLTKGGQALADKIMADNTK